jgi:hypothetical protein
MPIAAAVLHILGVVVIAINSVRLAGGRSRRPAPAVEEPDQSEQPPETPADESFLAPKFTPLQPV